MRKIVALLCLVFLSPWARAASVLSSGEALTQVRQSRGVVSGMLAETEKNLVRYGYALTGTDYKERLSEIQEQNDFTDYQCVLLLRYEKGHSTVFIQVNGYFRAKTNEKPNYVGIKDYKVNERVLF